MELNIPRPLPIVNIYRSLFTLRVYISMLVTQTKGTNFDCYILLLYKQGLLIDIIKVKYFLNFATDTQS